MYNPYLFAFEVLEAHDFGLLKGLMDGLIVFEGDLVFVDDDENPFERFNFFDK